ncbi:MAG: hypothetical protein M1831_004936 [Alyxoria varia]|nr:MAG: hypothetical protein M1831_004936 [Alyxoria varia]
MTTNPKEPDVLSDAASLPDDYPSNLTIASSSSSLSSFRDDDFPDDSHHESYPYSDVPPPYSAAAATATAQDPSHPSSSRLIHAEQLTESDPAEDPQPSYAQSNQPSRTEDTADARTWQNHRRRAPPPSNTQSSDPTANRVSRNKHGAPRIDYTAYIPTMLQPSGGGPSRSHPPVTLSADQSTITATLPTNYPVDALTALMRTQAELPPRPAIRIKGSHRGYTSWKTDFDLWIDLTRWFLPGDVAQFPSVEGCLFDGDEEVEQEAGMDEGRDNGPAYVNPHHQPNDPQSSRNITRPLQPSATSTTARNNGKPHHPTILHRGPSHLVQQTTSFHSHPTASKLLTLHRQPLHLHTPFLTSRVRALLASLNYRGNVDITYPVLYSRLVLKPSPEQEYEEREGEEKMRMAGKFWKGVKETLREPDRFDVDVGWMFADRDVEGDSLDEEWEDDGGDLVRELGGEGGSGRGGGRGGRGRRRRGGRGGRRGGRGGRGGRAAGTASEERTEARTASSTSSSSSPSPSHSPIPSHHPHDTKPPTTDPHHTPQHHHHNRPLHTTQLPKTQRTPTLTLEPALYRHHKHSIVSAALSRRVGGWLSVEEWADGVVAGALGRGNRTDGGLREKEAWGLDDY